MATATITPILPTRSRELLDECLALARRRLPATLSDVLTQVDDVLFNLANTAGTSTRQNLFFDAMRELRLKRHEIERAFLEHFNDNFADTLDLAKTLAGTGSAGFAGELSLVALDEVEENLAIGQFAESMKARCGQELFALEKRLSVLLKVPELDDVTSPLGTRAVGNALKHACQKLDADIEVKLTLYKLFDKLAGHGLMQLYSEINQHLVRCDILPMISKQPARAQATRKTRVIIESEQDSMEAAGEDVFSTLQTLMQGGGGGLGNAGGGRAFPGGGPNILGVGGGGYGSTAGGGAGGGFVAGMSAGGGSGGGGGSGFLSVPVLVDTLTSLQRGASGAGYAVAGSIEGGADGTPASGGAVNILRGLRENGITGQMAPAQDLTLEIVSLLFDYILEDPSIPDALKALLGRLQIPVLKVAILDKDVFSKKSHPARRLLDALASAAVGWHEGLQRSDALYAKVEEVVHRIVNEFDDDVGLFTRVLDDFNAFVEQESAAATARADASSRSLHTRERLVLAKLAVDEQLHARTRGREVREFIMQFLFDYWRQLLIITHVEAGTDSEAWAAQITAVDELVWSVQPKTTPEDRKELTARLPVLLKTIKGGMRTLEMAPADCSRFLSMLASVHVVSIKHIEESSIAARKLARVEQKPDPSQRETHVAPGTVDPASEEFIKQGLARLFERKGVEPLELDIDFSAFEAEAAPAPTAAEAADAEVAKYVELVTTLDLGDWVEFESEGGLRTRGRFTWISPTSGRYLFTDLHGEKMLDITLLDLAREFQNADATIIRAESDPLLDRALGALIEKLETEAAAA